MSVSKGTLDLSGGSTPQSTGDSGSYNAGSVGVIAFDGYTQIFAPSVTFPGSGQISISGNINLPARTSVTMSNLLLTGGTLAGRGTLTIPSSGTADLANGTLNGGLHFINDGTTTEAAIADIDMYDASVIENNATMTLADSADISNNPGYPTSGWIVDESGGSLSYTGSASSSSTTLDVPFDNFGSVTVTRGTLNLNSGSSSESVSGDTGSYSVAAAGVLAFGGYQDLAATASFAGDGQVVVNDELQVNSGTSISFPNLLLYGTLTGKGTVTIPSGDNATLSGGSLSGGVTFVR